MKLFGVALSRPCDGYDVMTPYDKTFIESDIAILIGSGVNASSASRGRLQCSVRGSRGTFWRFGGYEPKREKEPSWQNQNSLEASP